VFSQPVAVAASPTLQRSPLNPQTQKHHVLLSPSTSPTIRHTQLPNVRRMQLSTVCCAQPKVFAFPSQTLHIPLVKPNLSFQTF